MQAFRQALVKCHFLQASFSASVFSVGSARFVCKPTPKNCQDDNFGTRTD
jgi:hypothetical protein